MRVQPKRSITSLLVIFSLFAVMCKPLRADDGTPAQHRACAPDVFRLCSSSIPDHTAITKCLQHNIGRLNPDCRAVFEGDQRAEEPDEQPWSPRAKSGAETYSAVTGMRERVK